MRRILPIVVLGLACSFSTAQAQAKGDEFAALVREATQAFGKGEFDRAAQLAERAYAIRQDARLLYNIARAHEGAGRQEQALDFYRRYLAAEPKSEYLGLVSERIRVLETGIAERLRGDAERLEARGERQQAKLVYRRYLDSYPQAADRAEIERRIRALSEPPLRPKAPSRTPAPALVPAAARADIWPWLTLSAGVLALGAGGVFALVSRDKYQDAERAADGRSAADLAADGDRFTDYANAAFIGGGVLTLAGGVWLALNTSKESPASLVIQPSSLWVETVF